MHLELSLVIFAFFSQITREGILNPQDQDLLPSAIKYGQGGEERKWLLMKEAFKVNYCELDI